MDIESRYQQTLEYLYSFVDYSLTHADRYSPEKFDLGRMRVFAEHLGSPHTLYPIIHVAGTKGKGSVSALCAAALSQAGYKVGLYTSPHLQDYNERIQVDGQPISHATLNELVDELRPYLDAGTELTTFEITTALAFLYFARQGVTAAVFEVGLGGRLDATNIITPVVSVITSISYDHTQFLGNTLTAIAGEKAGIIKPGVPVVISPQKKEARLALERVAQERGAPLIQVGQDVRYVPEARSLHGQSLLVWPAGEQAQAAEYLEAAEPGAWEPLRLTIPLLGHHQVENAATAYAALRVASEHGLPVSVAAIQSGFATVSWPGRFEILSEHPLVLVDSAHNRDSALKLRLALDDYFPGRPVILIFGASEDKDIDGMFAELMPRIRQVVATRSFHPRAISPEALVEYAHRFGRPASITQSVEEALDLALHLAGEEALVLAAGSIFVAAGVRDTWLKKQTTVE
ncbi:MAG TPA: folylpolyglutamate synthase/dihydrofolate synthase family protein [Anaerolineales bacterium]|nr:folylpolyglutamate synthase/dihydrofolate synthase family protein [Anaerolineales bacterium]